MFCPQLYVSEENVHATELDFLCALELLQIAYKVRVSVCVCMYVAFRGIFCCNCGRGGGYAPKGVSALDGVVPGMWRGMCVYSQGLVIEGFCCCIV